MINNVLACKYGSHWITNPAVFKPEFQKGHQALITYLSEYCNSSSEEQFIKRYKLTFHTPELPPTWMMMEVLSLGKISRIYEGVLATEDRIYAIKKEKSVFK